MENLERLTLVEMEEVVENKRHLSCESMPANVAYPLIERVLKRRQYRKLSKGSTNDGLVAFHRSMSTPSGRFFSPI